MVLRLLTFTFNTVTLALPFIRDGRLVPVGVSSKTRSGLPPAAPPIAAVVEKVNIEDSAHIAQAAGIRTQ